MPEFYKIGGQMWGEPNSIIFLHPYDHRGYDHAYLDLGDKEAYIFRGVNEMNGNTGAFDRVVEALGEIGVQIIYADTVELYDMKKFEEYTTDMREEMDQICEHIITLGQIEEFQMKYAHMRFEGEIPLE